jgi:hypothetical protein
MTVEMTTPDENVFSEYGTPSKHLAIMHLLFHDISLPILTCLYSEMIFIFMACHPLHYFKVSLAAVLSLLVQSLFTKEGIATLQAKGIKLLNIYSSVISMFVSSLCSFIKINLPCSHHARRRNLQDYKSLTDQA